MRRSTAASYLDLSVTEFEREVATGRMPAPITLGKDEHWLRIAIDERLGEMTGAGKRDRRKNKPACQDIAVDASRSFPPLDASHPFLTVAKLAKRWGISNDRVRTLFRTGKIRGLRLGPQLIRFRPVDVLEDEKRLGFK